VLREKTTQKTAGLEQRWPGQPQLGALTPQLRSSLHEPTPLSFWPKKPDLSRRLANHYAKGVEKTAGAASGITR
jgi:hypothetical protein